MTSALSGLLGLGAVSCGGDSPKGEPDPIRQDAAAPVLTCPIPDGGVNGDTGEHTGHLPGTPSTSVDGSAADGGAPAMCLVLEPTVGEDVEGDRKFADITTECDRRGGYTQITSACSGTNACAGFSYGDWEPGVTTEHSCAGSNGCNGISCIVLPADHGLTGKQIYEYGLHDENPSILPDRAGHPRACTNCHGAYDEATKKVDPSKFKVYFRTGDGRTLENWKTVRTPAEEARIVAFGFQSFHEGVPYTSMAAYKRVFSRAEIERVVEYIRTSLEPINGGEIKFKDK